MKSKTAVWLILWIISALIGNAISFAAHLQYYAQPGATPTKNAILTDPSSTLAQIQAMLLLIYLPVTSFSLLGCTAYYAKKENQKAIRIFSIVMMGFVLFAMIVTFIQWIGA